MILSAASRSAATSRATIVVIPNCVIEPTVLTSASATEKRLYDSAERRRTVRIERIDDPTSPVTCPANRSDEPPSSDRVRAVTPSSGALVTEAGDLAAELVLEHPHVGFDHDPHKLLEAHRRLPAKLRLCLGRI